MYILGAVQTTKDWFPGLVISEATGLNCRTAVENGVLTPLDIQCGVCTLDNMWDYRILGSATLLACSLIVCGGVKYVTIVSPFFLIFVLLSVLLIWVGVLAAPGRDFASDVLLAGKGLSGDFAANVAANLGPAFEADLACLEVKRNGQPLYTEADLQFGFFQALALFFPSVTGIMAGSNRSGDLRNAQHSIPKGTLGAVAATSTIYLLTTLLYGAVATRTGLKTNYLLSADASIQGDIVRIGIILSSLGAGLQSLTGAPRLLQAIANDNLIPALKPFQGTGEPRRPLLLTFLICEACVLSGDINVIAPFITNFFLLCYTAVNAAVLIQGLLKEPNWRPRFHYYHSGTALLGMLLCLTIMFTTFFEFAIASIAVVSVLYKYIEYRKVTKQWGDGMRGLRMQTARQTLLSLEKLSTVHTKNWRPQVLLFARVNPDGLLAQPGLLPFVGQFKGARGITIISTAIQGDLMADAAVQMRVEKKLRQARDDHQIRGFTQVVMSEDIPTALDSLLQTAGLGGLGPNTVVTCWPTSWRTRITGADRMKQILTSAHAFNMALVLLRGIEEWPDSMSELNGTIDVWWVVHDGGLLLLLSIILRRHRTWRHTALRVFVVCQQGDDPGELRTVINRFLYNMRISAQLECIQLEAQLSGILPTRGAEWQTTEAGGFVPVVNKSIIRQSKPLGKLGKADSQALRGSHVAFEPASELCSSSGRHSDGAVAEEERSAKAKALKRGFSANSVFQSSVFLKSESSGTSPPPSPPEEPATEGWRDRLAGRFWSTGEPAPAPAAPPPAAAPEEVQLALAAPQTPVAPPVAKQHLVSPQVALSFYSAGITSPGMLSRSESGTMLSRSDYMLSPSSVQDAVELADVEAEAVIAEADADAAEAEAEAAVARAGAAKARAAAKAARARAERRRAVNDAQASAVVSSAMVSAQAHGEAAAVMAAASAEASVAAQANCTALLEAVATAAVAKVQAKADEAARVAAAAHAAATAAAAAVATKEVAAGGGDAEATAEVAASLAATSAASAAATSATLSAASAASAASATLQLPPSATSTASDVQPRSRKGKAACNLNPALDSVAPSAAEKPPKPARAATPAALHRTPTAPLASAGKRGAEVPEQTKQQATRALNRAMREHSSESNLVMTNLPLPKETDETASYMEHLEMLAEGIQRCLFVAGQRDAEVITMYS